MWRAFRKPYLATKVVRNILRRALDKPMPTCNEIWQCLRHPGNVADIDSGLAAVLSKRADPAVKLNDGEAAEAFKRTIQGGIYYACECEELLRAKS